MKTPEPILTTDLFPELRRHLLSLLNSLTSEEWAMPTTAGDWTVKNVALHLLGGDIGVLSRKRDGHSLPADDISNWHEFVAFIDGLNRVWLDATRRMSSRVLCDLIAHTGPQAEAYFASLDPFAEGDSVEWAGPGPQRQWLDIAREYTERWHHQQQIRDATNRHGLYEPRLFAPVLDTFVRAMPHTFRNVDGPEGTIVQLTITGRGGGEWALRRAKGKWELQVGGNAAAVSRVQLKGEDAWKVFTCGFRGKKALDCAEISGDRAIGAKVLETVSVIAEPPEA